MCIASCYMYLDIMHCCKLSTVCEESLYEDYIRFLKCLHIIMINVSFPVEPTHSS